jgi:hypothetical protein
MTPNLKSKIEKFYQHLLNSYFPFDAMCWALAELQLLLEKSYKKYSEKEVIKRVEKLFNSSVEYDAICWIIATIKVYLEEMGKYP